MKAKNLNNSSKKTRSLIKTVFAEMLSEKKELCKISVSELCKRADISRGSFYSHYDDIYGVGEEYENELIEKFFDTTKLFESQDIFAFIDSIFEFIRENHENYRLILKSNDFLFATKKMTTLASAKLNELCRMDPRIKNYAYMEIELETFIEGLLCEYIKTCRGHSQRTLDDFYEYTKYWVTNFTAARSKPM